MSNQYGNQQYNQDGLPITGGQPFNQGYPSPQPGYAQQPYSQPAYNQQPYAQPAYGQPQGFVGGPVNSYGQQMPAHVEQKSWVLTAVLAFFLGGLGVHNFYLGYTVRGVAQLAMNIIGWLLTATFFGAVIGLPLLSILGIWVLVELIMILVRSGSYRSDSRGVPLK
ncbi:NINE protein [Corynebacterium sp. A21]|uniref:NINE protein n=1 Tax=Corynebacterium sp. A21 TaxID=3457318 RepID=UPI003FCF8B14